MLKLKTADFKHPHPQPPARRPDPARRPHFPGRARPARARDRRHEFRLLGIGVSDLVRRRQGRPADLVDRRAAEGRTRHRPLRDKFGEEAVVKGLAFDVDDED